MNLPDIFYYIFQLWRIPMAIKYLNNFTLLNTRAISFWPFRCWLRHYNWLYPLLRTQWPTSKLCNNTEVCLQLHLPKYCWQLCWDIIVRLIWVGCAVFKGDREKNIGESWRRKKRSSKLFLMQKSYESLNYSYHR